MGRCYLNWICGVCLGVLVQACSDSSSGDGVSLDGGPAGATSTNRDSGSQPQPDRGPSGGTGVCSGPRAYAGVVSLFQEVLREGFVRLTDEEWSQDIYSKDYTPVWLSPALLRE